MNSVEVGILSALAGSALTFFGQQTSNRISMKQSLRSEKYSAYEDFLNTANRIIRLNDDLNERGADIEKIRKEQQEIATKLKSSPTPQEQDSLSKQLDKTSANLDELREVGKKALTDLDGFIFDMDRALSKLQLSASSLVLDLGQDLYFTIPKIQNRATPPLDKDKFHNFVSEARKDLDHPIKIRMFTGEIFKIHRKKDQVRIRPNR